MMATLERTSMGVRAPHATTPRISPLWAKWFSWYARGYLRRHFHTLRIARGGLPEEYNGFPVVIYLNHPSWWDPLVCAFLKNEFFPERDAYAPINQQMLDRYRFFRRIGFFGVESGKSRSAAQFLSTSAEILRSPRNVLFVTPQSRFSDVRERPLAFARGLGHLAAHVDRVLFLPLAIEYCYWEERFPEVLVRFGPPVSVQPELNAVFDACDWTRLFESKLTQIQDRLAALSQFRDPSDFRILLRGRSGVSRAYDSWRSVRARFRGESFRKDHGQK
jgi:1-acyl-sn-glycerol-3-phosphate acyltransferase